MQRPREVIVRRHQAPTLIGCELLKIDSRKGLQKPAETTQPLPPFRVCRSLQQRSEIMQPISRFVNIYFAHA
jgi:hypothetical protein